MTVRLKRTEPLETGLRRLGVECIDVALGALDESDGRDSAIHTVRKQCKQARGLLKLFRYGLDNDWRREAGVFRDIGRALSAARDGCVALDIHEWVNDKVGAALDSSVRAAIRQDLIADWQRFVAGQDQSRDAFGSEDIGGRLRAARLRARRWQLTAGDDSILQCGVVKSYRRARKAHRRAATTGVIGDFHEARKRTKDLVYALEAVELRFPDVAPELLKDVKQLADILGHMHDLEVYRAAIARAAGERNAAGVELLSALTHRRSLELAAEALQIGDATFAIKPSKFARRLEPAQEIDRVAS
jgi:CHAD domain-containing protein